MSHSRSRPSPGGFFVSFRSRNEVPGCEYGNVGQFPDEPQIAREWFGNEAPLVIDTAGLNGTDTILLVKAPNGVIHFNNDYISRDLKAPGGVTRPSTGGLHHLWAGIYDQTPGSASAIICPGSLPRAPVGLSTDICLSHRAG